MFVTCHLPLATCTISHRELFMTEEIFSSLVPWIPILWLATLSCIVLLWVTLAISLLLAQLRSLKQAGRENGQRTERVKEEIVLLVPACPDRHAPPANPPGISNICHRSKPARHREHKRLALSEA